MFKILNPCRKKSWAEMPGDERERFCDQCGHHVHAIASYSPAEQQALLNSSKPLCMVDSSPLWVPVPRRRLFAISFLAAVRPIWAQTGRLRIKIPAGAAKQPMPKTEIEVRDSDDRLVARTIAGDGLVALANLPAYDSLRVRVRADWYQDWERVIIVAPGQDLAVDCRLEFAHVGSASHVVVEEPFVPPPVGPRLPDDLTPRPPGIIVPTIRQPWWQRFRR